MIGAGDEFLFQSTRPQGARPKKSHQALVEALFQSTRPQGARLQPFFMFLQTLCFNPRARRGRDIVGDVYG